MIHNGELVGESALNGDEYRVDSAIVSDDGQDDIITQNHYMTILRQSVPCILNFQHTILPLTL